jgi:hypothetical protein
MSDEIVKVEEQQPITYFAATNAEEMAKAQGGLLVWIEGRKQHAGKEVSDLQQALNHARKNKWGMKALQYQLNKAKKLETYYEKIYLAVKQGYVLVPAFPIDVFAIRTDRKNPRKNNTWVKETHDAQSNSAVHSELLPAGEGEYKSDEARRTQEYSHNKKEKEYNGKEVETTIYHFQNEEFQDVTFPLIACKSEVMTAAAHAMVLKIFDEIGISTENAGHQSRTYHRGDPLIIGTIFGPGPRYCRKKCHFLISWHVNVADI